MRRIILFFVLINLTFNIAKAEELNGQVISKIPPNTLMPFRQEILGSMAFFPENTYSIINYANGKKDGLTIVFNKYEIIYSAWYKNDILDGTLCLFPNGILSAVVDIKNGKLNGECRISFRPYIYSQGSTAVSYSNYNIAEIGAPEEDWITNEAQDFQLSSVGVFKDGKRYSGEFLDIESFMDVRKVAVGTYSDFKKIKQSDFKVFKLKPHAVADSKYEVVEKNKINN